MYKVSGIIHNINMEKKYPGMTVNQCVYISGLLGEFDNAVKEKDPAKSVLILRKVELTDEAIEQILESLGLILTGDGNDV